MPTTVEDAKFRANMYRELADLHYERGMELAHKGEYRAGFAEADQCRTYREYAEDIFYLIMGLEPRYQPIIKIMLGEIV